SWQKTRVLYSKNVKNNLQQPIQPGKKGPRSTRVPRHKPPIPTIHEENSPEKKVLQALFKFTLRIVIGPHPPLFFSSHTDPATAFIKEQTRQKPESTCQLWIDTAQH